jgi:O-antigen ligase
VERRWPGWELALWRERCGEDAACVAAHPDRRFAALQDHLHQDFLETLAERGLPGLAALLLTFAVAARGAAARRGPRAAALAGALTVLAARANLDFPLSRPADLVLLAALVGLSRSPEEA